MAIKEPDLTRHDAEYKKLASERRKLREERERNRDRMAEIHRDPAFDAQNRQFARVHEFRTNIPSGGSLGQATVERVQAEVGNRGNLVAELEKISLREREIDERMAETEPLIITAKHRAEAGMRDDLTQSYRATTKAAIDALTAAYAPLVPVIAANHRLRGTAPEVPGRVSRVSPPLAVPKLLEDQVLAMIEFCAGAVDAGIVSLREIPADMQAEVETWPRQAVYGRKTPESWTA